MFQRFKKKNIKWNVLYMEKELQTLRGRGAKKNILRTTKKEIEY